jgi:hypothetical protein
VTGDRRRAIAQAWIAAALADPRPLAPRGAAGRFRDPAGHLLEESLSALVEQVLGPMDPAVVAAALTRLAGLRAVQDVPPSAALAVVFRLRTILEDERGRGDDEDVARAAARVDDVALRAVDAYVEARERLHRAQLGELRRKLAVLERMVAHDVERAHPHASPASPAAAAREAVTS